MMKNSDRVNFNSSWKLVILRMDYFIFKEIPAKNVFINETLEEVIIRCFDFDKSFVFDVKFIP